MGLDTEDGRTMNEHFEKAALLWKEYKNRLGCSTHAHMQFALRDLVLEHDLHEIEMPFNKEDIDRVVKAMPVDKALGPDGFNGLFRKKCWHIIKEDVYNLCFDFFNGMVSLQAISTSFITLVPRVSNPSMVNDFRSISLINCILSSYLWFIEINMVL
jgi:hypothetical protein